jgi:glycosyltransferase involved in cell wall biosynthesis
MKLGIISDCTHYKGADGRMGTENHILLRQLKALSSYFDETIICCPFGKTDDKKVLTFYDQDNVKFIELPLVGGDTLMDKIKIIKALPSWFKSFNKVNSLSDVVYQRFPANLSIPAFFYLYFKQKKVFATYTGTWLNYTGEPSTYRLQKSLLKKYFRGPVWVYTDKEKFSNRIFSGISPSYSIDEWNEETEQVRLRIEKIRNEGISKFRLITVGTLISYKNQLTILKACVILKSRNFPFSLKIVGDGPMFNELKNFIINNNLQDSVELSGKKNYLQLRDLYRQSDFVVQAPLSEGFGKVPIEGFFHGVIPVINDISLARQMTGNDERGFLFNGRDAENLAETLIGIKEVVNNLPPIITKGRDYAKSQTLETWAEEYYKTVMDYFEKA